MMPSESPTKPLYINGAYYDGPRRTFSSAPPQASRRDGTGSYHHSGSISCAILKFIFGIVVIFALICFLIRIILNPTPVEFYVEGASLTQFNLLNKNTLYYNLKLNLSIWNQNKKIGIYYDELEAAAYYRNQRFGWVPLPTFYQGHNTVTFLGADFAGQSVMVGGDLVTELDQDQRNGLFNIDIRFRPKMRYKIGKLKTTRFSRKLWCHFQVPLAWKKDAYKYEGLRRLTKCHGLWF